MAAAAATASVAAADVAAASAREGVVSSVVLVAAGVVRVADDLVRDGLLVRQQLLQGDDGGQQEGDLTDQKGLAGDESDGSKDQGQESGSLQLHHQKQREQDLTSFLDCKKREAFRLTKNYSFK